MGFFIFKKKTGFTLIEVLVVIAIIGVLSSLAIVALGNARQKARDNKRLADIKQIASALELYYADNGNYPEAITPGQSLASPDGSSVYLSTIPSNPNPRNDGECIDEDYGYASYPGKSYYIFSCIGNSFGDLASGHITYNPDNGFSSGCGVAVDADGNIYNTVVIGTQCWMKENLKVGYRIDGALNQDTPLGDIIDKYCYDDLSENCDAYGGLYQWHTAMALDKSCDTSNCSAQINSQHQGICPNGWHIPSDEEMSNLTDYLAFEGQGGLGDIDDIGGKLKEAGIVHWSAEVCDDGIAPVNLCDGSRFSARGAGLCDLGGSFELINSGSIFWSSLQSESDNNFAWARDLSATGSVIYKTGYEKLIGASVRCIKN